jgi:hypothetical protein
MIGMTPFSWQMVCYEVRETEASARRSSPSNYVASAVLSAELSCCPQKLRTSISS